MERLQKILSAAGVASRRAAEALIAEGRVSVNGAIVATPGAKADAERDDIRVDGRRVRAAPRRRYILLNKPRGYMTTRQDPERRPTVLDLLPEVRDYIYPVGRLDYDSEGLLLLTNDGELAVRLLHPKHEVEREYHARVRGVPDEDALDRLRRGLVINGRRTAPAAARLLATGLGARGDQSLVSITLHEGRTRQARDMCDAVGHPVVRLRRVRFGPIADKALKVGEHRDLTRGEVAALKRAAGARINGPADRRSGPPGLEPSRRRHRTPPPPEGPPPGPRQAGRAASTGRSDRPLPSPADRSRGRRPSPRPSGGRRGR
ncbi:MAG TPA: pseudouridine synthase [Vicinamibacterales bacterium]|nr:pseudouridine synthase [Vicinamibacterales bacterium]